MVGWIAVLDTSYRNQNSILVNGSMLYCYIIPVESTLVGCIFWPALGCCKCQTLVERSLFNFLFFTLKMIKGEKGNKNDSKWGRKHVFGTCTQKMVEGFNSLIQRFWVVFTIWSPFCLIFLSFSPFFTLFIQKTWKILFWLALGMHSTQTKAEIYNTCRHNHKFSFFKVGQFIKFPSKYNGYIGA